MITAMNRIYVVPEYAEQFEQRFRTRARLDLDPEPRGKPVPFHGT